MLPPDWELTVQQIVDESTQERDNALKHKILTDWRVKLEQKPALLQPYQIDKIVREVRRRLDSPAPK